MGFPVIKPCNFANAMKEPVKVTLPIKVPSRIVTPVVLTPIPGVATNSAIATSAEAPPPKALNIPTSSGIEVISTERAAAPPITPPMTTPTRIQVQSIHPVSSTVAMIARSIARAARPFPFRAVAGD